VRIGGNQSYVLLYDGNQSYILLCDGNQSHVLHYEKINLILFFALVELKR